MSLKGMVTGGFLGDAFSLGAHWIYDLDEITSNFGIYNQVSEPLPGTFHKGKHKGDFTHYGDQSFMLLKYMSKNKGFEYEGFKEYWINEMKNYNGYKDKATKCSLEYFQKGYPYGYESMELGGAARIGSIIYFSENEEEALKNGIGQAQLTHTSFQSLLTTEFFIKLIYKMLSDKNIEEAIKSIIAEYKDENKQFSYLENAYLKAKENLELDYKEAIMNIGQTCNGCEAFPAILYFILKYDNFKEAEIANVNSGGDSAARGIIIGMIFGARDGEEALTKEWLAAMNKKSEIEEIIKK